MAAIAKAYISILPDFTSFGRLLTDNLRRVNAEGEGKSLGQGVTRGVEGETRGIKGKIERGLSGVGAPIGRREGQALSRDLNKAIGNGSSGTKRNLDQMLGGFGAPAGQREGKALSSNLAEHAAAGSTGTKGKLASALGGFGAPVGDREGKNLTGKLGSTIEGEASKLKGVGQRLGNSLGIPLGAGLAAGAAIGGIAVVKLATTFQTSMEMIHTQAGVAQSAIPGLSSDVLGLAASVGTDPNSLAQALFHVESTFASVGITGAKAMEILKVAAQGAVIGQSNLVDTTNALDAAVVSGIAPLLTYNQTMGVLNATVGSGDMHMQDLADAFGTGALAVIKNFGVTIQDAGAALAVFGDNNIRGAKAGTQLRMSIQALGAPTKPGKNFLDQLLGSYQNLQDDMRKGGLRLAINDLVTHLNAAGYTGSKLGSILTETFGKRAGVGITLLSGQVDRLNSKYPDIEKHVNGVGEAWAQTTKTFKFHQQALKAGIDALGISIGVKLIPYVQAAVDGLSHFVTGMSNGTGWGGKFATVMTIIGNIIRDFRVPLEILSVTIAGLWVTRKAVAFLSILGDVKKAWLAIRGAAAAAGIAEAAAGARGGAAGVAGAGAKAAAGAAGAEVAAGAGGAGLIAAVGGPQVVIAALAAGTLVAASWLKGFKKQLAAGGADRKPASDFAKAQSDMMSSSLTTGLKGIGEGLKIAGGNLVHDVAQGASAAWNGAKSQSKQDASEWTSAMAVGMGAKKPEVKAAAFSLVTSSQGAFNALGPDAKQFGYNAGNTFANSIRERGPFVKSAADSLTKTGSDSFGELVKKATAPGVEAGMAFSQSIGKQQPAASSNAFSLVNSAYGVFSTLPEKAAARGKDSGIDFGKLMGLQAPTVNKAAGTLVTNAEVPFSRLPGIAQTQGQDSGKSLGLGLTQLNPYVKKSALDTGTNVNTGFHAANIPNAAKAVAAGGVNGFAGIWQQLPAKITGPLSSALSFVNNSILKPLNAVTSKFGVTVGGVTSVAFKPPPPLFPVQPFATGGGVFGAGTATSDSIPALLSNGEHVLTAREVKGFGGHDKVEKMREAARTGQPSACADGGAISKFAFGGQVGGIGYAGLVPEFKKRLIAFSKGINHDIQITSGFRTHAEQMALFNNSDGSGHSVAFPSGGGHPGSEHEKGLAADIVYPLEYTSDGNKSRQYGLYYPMSWENWHIQPIGLDPAGMGSHDNQGGAWSGGGGSFASTVNSDAMKKFMSGPAKLLSHIGSKPEVPNHLISNVMTKVFAAAQAKAAAADAAASSSGGGSGNFGSAQASSAALMPNVLKVLSQLHQPANLANAVISLIMHESGGDAHSVNKYDSNWTAGTPSVGLAQVIGPTFAAYAGPYAHTPPMAYGVSEDPVANIFAGMNYGIHQYGSISNIPGIKSLQNGGGYKPYDTGGLASGSGWLPKITSRPERVLSPQQTEWFESAMKTAGGGGHTCTHNIQVSLDGKPFHDAIEVAIDGQAVSMARALSNGRAH